MSAKMVTTLREIQTIFDQVNVGKKVLDKISVWRGDITKLEIDAIVNAANSELAGGGGVDGAIHNAAGRRELQAECRKIGRCAVGDTVATSACKLTHVKKILHTVGPQVWDDLTKSDRVKLLNCYATSLELAVENGLKSIAFPCISTGIYGYPNDDAATSVMNFLCKFFLKSQHRDKIDRVVLCLFLEVDNRCYNNEIQRVTEYFTKLDARSGKDGSQETTQSQQAADKGPSTDNTQEAEADASTQSQLASTEASSQSHTSTTTEVSFQSADQANSPSQGRSTEVETTVQSLLDTTENEENRVNAINNCAKMAGAVKEVVPAQVDENEGEKAPFNSLTKL
ncbi:unnamed protein product, partial [Mesorhabditis belari]|uniref:Macro domain-containing protein n=1 Tax=Mesorhabditis belari TaxID=2138241 RepID=A0AAF3EVY1_9BILA